MTVESWLEEHRKWKDRQKVGLLPAPLCAVDSYQQVTGGMVQGMSLVELSFEAHMESAKRRGASLGLVKPKKTLQIRRCPASKPSKSSIETTKMPIALQLDSQDSVYEDPKTHRLVAYIRVPSLRKAAASAAGSKRSTATRFHIVEDSPVSRFAIAPRSVQHRRPVLVPDTPPLDQWSRSNSPLECRYPAK